MTGRRVVRAVFATALCLSAACSDDDKPASDASAEPSESGDGGGNNEDADAGSAKPLGFFVSSDTSATGDLGGLAAADARCQRLAAAVGAGGRSWRAYLSVESDADNAGGPTHARDRIGDGPWYNAKGALVAEDVEALHALPNGDPELFLDESGEKINGQWDGSPKPNEHDVLTGSDAEGRVMAERTCANWTSADAALKARVGHSDGLGPQMNPNPPYHSWNSSHDSGGCNNTTPGGGAGRIYCFAAE